MKRKRGIRGFTLLEIIVVISIIALLAALLLGNGDSVSSKRRLTQSTLQTIQSALERYHSQYGEYPEPVNADETAEIMPGKAYPIGAARCLYQALRGDGSDAIKGVGTMEKTKPARMEQSTRMKSKTASSQTCRRACGAR